MKTKKAYVIGSGPNGLTAAIVLARAGVRTTVLEAKATIGGGTRSAELTLPGFVHDICSAVHPMALSSPIFSTFPLAEHGLRWIHPPAPLVHAFEKHPITIERSVEKTAESFGVDNHRYQQLIGPLVKQWPALMSEILKPVGFPKHPLLMARFGLLSAGSAKRMTRLLFKSEETRAAFAGMAAHSFLPMEALGSAAFGWVLLLSAHAVGWPVPQGGSQKIADALASYFQSLGGEIITDQNVSTLKELRDADTILADVSPKQLLKIAGDRLPKNYRRSLESYRYGPGVFKMDWALSGPIPWTTSAYARAATVHIGGTMEEVAASEEGPVNGRVSERPFVLLAQPSLFDSFRAPAGQHTAWAYCHVPNGFEGDVSHRIESQIERFAPGFRSRVLARHIFTPKDLENHNANLVGGDINGGLADIKQLLLRPTRSHYRTPVRGLYLCSASTPPGGGVHGMCGYHAATTALGDVPA